MFLSHPLGHLWVTYAIHPIELEFYSQKRQIPVLSHTLKDLGVTYALHLRLVGKGMIDFLFAIIEHFLPALRVQTL